MQTLRKDFKGAEHQFRTAIALDQTCADAHNHLGWLLQNSKGEAGADEAETQFRAAIALDPTYTDAHVNNMKSSCCHLLFNWYICPVWLD